VKQARPVTPRIEFDEIVGAHQPDETDLRHASPQGANRIDCVTSAQRALDIGYADRGASRHSSRAGQSRRQWRHAGIGFERILRRHQPPHSVQAKLGDRLKRNMAVTLMRGIERAAHQTDTRLPPRRRQKASEFAVKRAGFGQGRVCPLPRTTYL